MTYKTRQEVFRAAADWIDVCEAADVEALCKIAGCIRKIKNLIFDCPWEDYEFPLALLEGKEVWVGSELYNRNGIKFTAAKITKCGTGAIVNSDESIGDIPSYCSWNPPKPKTVMVEMLVEDAKDIEQYWDMFTNSEIAKRVCSSIKKSIENLE